MSFDFFHLALTLTIILLLIRLVSLHRKMRVLRWCYIDLSDWAAGYADEVAQQSKWITQDFASAMNVSKEEAEMSIYNDLSEGKLHWGALVDYHFRTMKNNSIALPSPSDNPILTSWFKGAKYVKPKTSLDEELASNLNDDETNNLTSNKLN